ncbi:MAG: ETC complex I subunit [Proteobacteria bacterium]|nr:ETC complex I subunit [Pseudomonadota bacterium]MDA1059405.1 ETC complex I subunit [Pseudomonadota bacterium]
MKARIFQPPKNAMQSGRANTRRWRLEYELDSPREIEPLMGWTSSGDMAQQLSLTFDTQAEAVAFAKKHGIAYQVQDTKVRTIRPKSYADNFKADRMV